MNILNLTQHAATSEQVAQGVVDLDDAQKAELASLLTFGAIPNREQLAHRAASVAELADRAHTAAVLADPANGGIGAVMIGGAPFFMASLERALAEHFTVLYAFSVRESADHAQPDGGVRKVAVFRHAGFVEA